MARSGCTGFGSRPSRIFVILVVKLYQIKLIILILLEIYVRYIHKLYIVIGLCLPLSILHVILPITKAANSVECSFLNSY